MVDVVKEGGGGRRACWWMGVLDWGSCEEYIHMCIEGIL